MLTVAIKQRKSNSASSFRCNRAEQTRPSPTQEFINNTCDRITFYARRWLTCVQIYYVLYTCALFFIIIKGFPSIFLRSSSFSYGNICSSLHSASSSYPHPGAVEFVPLYYLRCIVCRPLRTPLRLPSRAYPPIRLSCIVPPHRLDPLGSVLGLQRF